MLGTSPFRQGGHEGVKAEAHTRTGMVVGLANQTPVLGAGERCKVGLVRREWGLWGLWGLWGSEQIGRRRIKLNLPRRSGRRRSSGIGVGVVVVVGVGVGPLGDLGDLGRFFARSLARLLADLGLMK
jgi:hypothetical protein